MILIADSSYGLRATNLFISSEPSIPFKLSTPFVSCGVIEVIYISSILNPSLFTLILGVNLVIPGEGAKIIVTKFK